MADNKMSFSTATTKQKVIGVLTVVIVGFIIYEVIGIFSASSNSSTPAIPPTFKKSPQQPKQMSATAPAPLFSAPSQGTTQPMTPSPSVTVSNAVTPPPKENIDLQKQEQEQQVYLDSVNQLQLLKVKREIAETNQAIASARLATETANKNMSDLLTQPALPTAPNGNITSKPGTPMAGTAIGTTDQGGETPAKPQPVVEIPFTVVSISMKLNHWNAVLSYQNKFYSVSIGDTLFDGSSVFTITKNGVVLEREGKKRRIPIQAMI